MLLSQQRNAARGRVCSPLGARFLRFFVLLNLFVGILPMGAHQASAQDFVFERVVIEGNARIGDSAILAQAGVATDTPISAGALNDSYQALQDSGLFESVEVTPQGASLLITVTEFPTINRIAFEGNDRINDETLATVVTSAPRRAFSPALAEQDAQAISDAYAIEGRLASRVTPRIIRLRDNRVDLVFEVFEGAVVEVERLSFVGNRVFSDRRLRRVLATKQAGLFRALVRSDTFVEDRVEFDKQVLRDFYQSRGYVDFEITAVNAELTTERDGYFVTFDVTEGQQLTFGEITVRSELDDVDGDEFRAITKLATGKPYTPFAVEQDIARMERLGIRKSVDFLRVEPRVTRNARERTLDVEFVLTRGPKVFVERIDIEGNTTTLDRIVRRQFRIAEGDPFNAREIRESAARIRALGFFESAEVNAREGSAPDRVIVDVDVVEKPTGSLNFGGTYSATSGFGLAASFQERNFVGRGQTLSLSVTTAEESENYGLTFFEPALLGRDVGFRFNAQYGTTESSTLSYDTDQLVLEPSLVFPLSEFGRLQVRYTAEEVEMVARDPVAHGSVIAGDIAAGPQRQSSLGYTYSYDTRSTGLNPDAGVLVELSQDFAALGGDSEFLRTTAKIVGQRRLVNQDVRLTAAFEAGALSWGGGTNRVADRFILGTNILRGFEPGGIGPRDQSGTVDNTLGGNLYTAARFEAEFPLGLPEEYGIRGAVFYDLANLWDLSDVDQTGGTIVGEGGALRHVLGVSVLWQTPLGPLRFNFTDAIKKESFDRDQSFDLTISTSF